MDITRAIRGLAALLLVAAFGCADGFSHSVQVTIPADIPSIPDGRLYLTLYQYDPLLADGPAQRVDQQVVMFSHDAGTRTVRLMQVSGDIERGNRHYIAVEGCMMTSEGERRVLHDGLMVDTPDEVTMRWLGTFSVCQR